MFQILYLSVYLKDEMLHLGIARSISNVFRGCHLCFDILTVKW
jgi:hypothetical protein